MEKVKSECVHAKRELSVFGINRISGEKREAMKCVECGDVLLTITPNAIEPSEMVATTPLEKKKIKKAKKSKKAV